MNDETKQIADSFRCKYTVFEKGTDPDLVEQAYLKAYELGKKEGFCPAIVCLNEYVGPLLQEMEKEGYNIQDEIAKCQDNGKEILEERFQEYTECCDEDELIDFIGEETEGEAVTNFIGCCSYEDGTLEADTLLLEIPVKNPWEVVAYIPLGGWNEYPATDDMLAICKYWYKKYNAVPAAFTNDVMEFYAPSGLNGVDSLEAAKEHYGFCSDRVDQGTQTYKLSELAAGLEKSKVWYFWWD